jgi:hypothetical protein
LRERERGVWYKDQIVVTFLERLKVSFFLLLVCIGFEREGLWAGGYYLEVPAKWTLLKMHLRSAAENVSALVNKTVAWLPSAAPDLWRT